MQHLTDKNNKRKYLNETEPDENGNEINENENVIKVKIENNEQKNNKRIATDRCFPVVPISSLKHSSQRWSIEARVTFKTELKTYFNKKKCNESSLFSVDLIDQANSEIQAIFYDQACQKFFQVIQLGMVYKFSLGEVTQRISTKNCRLSTPLILTFHVKSTIKSIIDDCSIVSNFFRFQSIEKLQWCHDESIVDVIGVVMQIGDLSMMTCKNRSNLEKREVILVDNSHHQIVCFVFGKQALELNLYVNSFPILAIKGVRVSTFRGRTLSAQLCSTFSYNPAQLFETETLIDLQHDLRNKPSSKFKFTMMTEPVLLYGERDPNESGGRLTVSQLVARSVELSDSSGKKEVFFGTVVASVFHVFRNANTCYKGCSNKECYKLVVPTTDGSWWCNDCQIITTDYKSKFLLCVRICDHTGDHVVTLHDKHAETILSSSAASLGDSTDEQQFARLVEQVAFKPWIMRVKVKRVVGSYDVKSTVIALWSLNLEKECANLQKEL